MSGIKKRVLLNGSTMFDGGGMQVLLNFISDSLRQSSNIEWYYLLSKRAEKFLGEIGVSLPEEKTFILEKSPTNPIYWLPQFLKFKAWERKLDFDIVYSISSPSYFFFRAKEVQRITNPYLTNANRFSFEVLPRSLRLKWKIKFWIQKIFLSKSDYFITQTNLIKSKLGLHFYSKNKPVEIVPNAVSTFFLTETSERLPKQNWIFCIATANWHKNIHQLGEVAWHLRELNQSLDFKFITTIDHESEIFKILRRRTLELQLEDRFIHLGRVPQVKCREYYLKSKVTFLPSILEVFSASIIESIHFKTPVLTTDLNFNRELILNSEYLFQPNDWREAAEKLSRFLGEPDFGEVMIKSVSSSLDLISSAEAFQKTEEVLLKFTQH